MCRTPHENDGDLSVFALGRLKTLDAVESTMWRSSPLTTHRVSDWTWRGNAQFLDDLLDDARGRRAVVFLSSAPGRPKVGRRAALLRSLVATAPGAALAVTVLAHEVAYLLARGARFRWLDGGVNLEVIRPGARRGGAADRDGCAADRDGCAADRDGCAADRDVREALAFAAG